MTTKPVTYTIPKSLDAALHAKLGRGEISQFVTRALWDALKKEEEALLMECLEADKDIGNIEVRNDFSAIEGEDFEGVEDFDFGESVAHERKLPKKGEVYWVRLDPTDGKEINKTRPCLVVSCDIINRSEIIVVVPITSKVQKVFSRIEVKITLAGQPGKIMPRHMRSIDRTKRVGKKIGQISPERWNR